MEQLTAVDDYESLPESLHPAIHMAAGALAGVGEHCVMYPVDVVKVCLLILFFSFLEIISKFF